MLNTTKEEVEILIQSNINPALSKHNGFVDLIEIEEEDNEVLVVLQFFGGCQGCPSAQGSTLKQINNFLQKELDPLKIKVLNVDFM